MRMNRFVAMEEAASEAVVDTVDESALEVDVTGLLEVDRAAASESEQLQNAAGAVVSLEAIAGFLASKENAEGVSRAAAQFANIAIENICADSGLPSERLVFSMESYKQSPVVALEGALDAISGKISDIWAYIKTKLVAFFRLLAEKMDFFKRNVGNLERKLHALNGRAANIAADAPKSTGAIQARWSYHHLIYLEKGFPKHAGGVATDVGTLLTEHSALFSKTIAKYTQWLESNHSAASQDIKCFDSLSVEKEDFLMLKAQPHHRSVGLQFPEPGNMLYRSKELPGGQAIYTEIEPDDKHGLPAIDMLAKVKVFIEAFDPKSYDRRALEVAEQARVDIEQWYASLPADVREKTPPPPSIDPEEVATVPGTGRCVTINPDMVFELLTPTLIKERLQEVTQTLKKIKEWYDVVFNQIWKDKDFDRLASSLVQRKDVRAYSEGVYLNQAPKYLGSLALAVMHLMANATENVHAFAFTTCFALLDYVEDSIKRYPTKR